MECRLIVDPPQSGPWNMAVDEALLVDSAEHGAATLRFYEWSEPTLSLGYFQRYEDRNRHPASCEAALVRRQTGGGAILHDRELTYSIALPATHPLARHAPELYVAVHDAFIEVLRSLTTVSGTGWTLHRHELTSRPAGIAEPFLCFERRAFGDVVLVGKNDQEGPPGEAIRSAHSAAVAGCRGAKILGSAQRRHRGALLQHGSLLLEKSAYAPQLAGWNELTGLHLSGKVLILRLGDRLAQALRVDLLDSGLSEALESKSRELRRGKYCAAGWTSRR